MALPTTGLTLRLESDAGVTYDANGVSAWADQSAAAFPDFVQATDANKPARLTGVFGTLPGIYFDGTSDFMTSTGLLSALLSASAFEALFVVKPIRNGTINSIATANGLITGNNAAPQVSLCKCGLTTQVGLGNSIKPAGTYVNSAQASILDGKSYMMGVTFNGTSWSTFNPITRSLDLADTTCAAIAGLTQSVLMGKSGDGNVFFKGYVAGIYLWSAQLTTKQRTDAWEYAKAKFSVTVPHVFVDGSMADDTSTDPKMTTAHKFYQTAITKYSGYYGTRIMLRRTIDEAVAATATPTGNGTSRDMMEIVTWPRSEVTGITGDFTQGSRSVTSVSGKTMSFRADSTRFITAPDGRIYRIEAVPGTDSFNLFTPYIGADSTGGTFKINKDDYYDEVQTLTAYDGADDLATWNADADDRVSIKGVAGQARYPYFTSTGAFYWLLKNILFTILHTTSGSIRSDSNIFMSGVSIDVPVNTIGLNCGSGGDAHLDGVTIRGSGNASHTSNFGWAIYAGEAKYVGIYSCYYSLTMAANQQVSLKNSLLGVSGQSTSGKEINDSAAVQYSAERVTLINTAFHPSSVEYNSLAGNIAGAVSLPNMLSKDHNQIKDYNKMLYRMKGYILTNDGSSGVSLRNSANCGFALECLFNIGTTAGSLGSAGKRTTQENTAYAIMIFEHRIRISQLKNYRVYINSDDCLCQNTAWLEIEYVDGASGTSLHTTLVKSTGEILAKTSTSDWSQYLVPPTEAIQPAIESEVIVRLFISYYHPTNKIFVDPYIDDIGIAPTVFQGMANIQQKYVVPKDLTFAEEVNRNTADSTKYKADEHFLLHNVDTVGSYAGGSLTDPAAPAKVVAMALSATSIRVMWYFVPMVATYDVYRLIDAVWTKVVADVAGESADITGLTASTSYSFRVIAKNEAGSSDPSATITVSTKGITGVFERFPASMAEMICGKDSAGNVIAGLGMTKANGNWFDWVDAWTEDAAKVDASAGEAWCFIRMPDNNTEENRDTIDTPSSTDASNIVRYEVDVWVKMAAVTDNPNRDYKFQLGRALEDLKKLFFKSYGLLPGSGCDQIRYMGADMASGVSGDTLVAGKMTVRFEVDYVQDKNEPNNTF